jgi:hypothetical protein
LWNPRHDEADSFFTVNARIFSRDEYRHQLFYGVFTAAANSALEIAMETIRAVTSTPDGTAYAYSLVDAALRTHQAVASPGEARLTYIRRFKAKKILTGGIEIEIEIVYNMYRMRRFPPNTVCAGCCLWALPTMPYRKLTSQG